jgi:hypothetical protein
MADRSCARRQNAQPRDFTPEEFFEFEIGTEEEGQAYQQAWQVDALYKEVRLAGKFLEAHRSMAGWLKSGEHV